MSDTKPEQSTTEPKKVIPLSEIEKHNTPNDMWLAINGKVYDVTSFLPQHPGGEEVLMEYAGGDGTEAYEDVGHSETADDYLKDLYIGEGNPEELKVSAKKHTETGHSESQGGSSGKFIYICILIAVISYFYMKKN